MNVGDLLKCGDKIAVIVEIKSESKQVSDLYTLKWFHNGKLLHITESVMKLYCFEKVNQ